jgi:chromosome partitioning protein
MAKVISWNHDKGGVGKTVSVVETAYILGKVHKARVLVIDLDGQANCTKHITGTVPLKGIYNLLMGEDIQWHDLLLDAQGDWGNVVVLPATKLLSNFEKSLPADRLERELILAEVLEPIKPHFDFIMIDNAPNIDLRAINALAAADYYVIPTDSSEYSLDGVRSIQAYAKAVAKRLNPKLELLAVFVAGHDKGNSIVVRAIMEELKELAPGKFWGTIPNSVKILEAQKLNTSVLQVAPDTKVAEQYLSLVAHIKEAVHG